MASMCLLPERAQETMPASFGHGALVAVNSSTCQTQGSGTPHGHTREPLYVESGRVAGRDAKWRPGLKIKGDDEDPHAGGGHYHDHSTIVPMHGAACTPLQRDGYTELMTWWPPPLPKNAGVQGAKWCFDYILPGT